MSKEDVTIKTKEDLIRLVNEWGFLPFFRNEIQGFSVEDHVAPGLWFTGNPGPWEWKGPVIRETGCAYGKFFQKKAAFISMEWFPDFANYRRDGYDFDARYDDGLAQHRDKRLFELVDANAPILSKSLKQIGDYRKGGNKGFETIITRLQSQCYVVISDFAYAMDKQGKEYGWGIAQYSTPEHFMGNAFTQCVYEREPEESYAKVLAHLKEILPDVEEEVLKKFIA